MPASRRRRKTSPARRPNSSSGCQKKFREKITGTTADRPQLKKLMAALAHGDVVIIPAVDRLSRDTTDLLVIAREMQRAGAGIRSLAEPFLDTTSDFAEIVFAILGVAAKLEHRRTAQGRADAKAKDAKFGRKPKLTPHQQREAIRRRDVDGETLRSIARSYNVSPQTISVNNLIAPHSTLQGWIDDKRVNSDNGLRPNSEQEHKISC
jgi:DNA invertase Pin-like site-specific DNA recombinase